MTVYPGISSAIPLEAPSHALHPMSNVDIDNRELERIKRQAKQEAEWEARAAAGDAEEATKHHLRVNLTNFSSSGYVPSHSQIPLMTSRWRRRGGRSRSA